MNFLKINNDPYLYNILQVTLGGLLGMFIGISLIPWYVVFNIILLTVTIICIFTREHSFSSEYVYAVSLFELIKVDKSYLMYCGYVSAISGVCIGNIIRLCLLQ